jgi:hypothetical protein
MKGLKLDRLVGSLQLVESKGGIGDKFGNEWTSDEYNRNEESIERLLEGRSI